MKRVLVLAALAVTATAAAQDARSFAEQRSKIHAGSPRADDAELERVLSV